MNAESLRAIKSFPSLVKYLRDELSWPIEAGDFDDLTFDYSPAELGLDQKTAAKVREIKQLRPLLGAGAQPWGIFFINFEPKRLPVVALRRVLGHLVLRKRAGANKSERPAWNTHDLLFISSYGESDHRDIAFAHFADEAEGTTDLPVLRVLGWDDEDTVLHLDNAQKVLAERLRWPEDTGDASAWRARWSDAFRLRHYYVIRTSRDLSTQMAALATRIRKRVNRALAVENDSGPLRQLVRAFREALIHDLSDDDFADMFAQTITYGLLSARVSRPSALIADNVIDMVPITNPFLRDILSTFLTVGGRKGKIDFDELGINDVVEAMRESDMEAVLRDFGDRNPQEDPVIHFYELFLKEYDADKRMQRGVFYTPRPVVAYIVRSVHELLQTEFGLEDGLASTVTWAEMLGKHKGIKLPEIETVDPQTREISRKPIDPQTPFVQILDPATGTATFLVEVIDVIRETMAARWKKEGRSELLDTPGLWNEYVPKHLLPRLHGYELMMAPYAIAHMKLGLKLFETGYRFASGERARIFLTNALEPPQDFSGKLELVAPALAHEAQSVNAVKCDQRFTVVIGNPPYSASSWNQGEWITGIAEDYKRSVRSEESQIQALSNDYIKFLRLAEWEIERAGSGIIGMITGHGYLHGTQPRDLRAHLSTTFERCLCLDLHGSIRRVGTHSAEDEPVFEIMQGVAIIIAFVRSLSRAVGTTTYASLTGGVGQKFSYLMENTARVGSPGISVYKPSPPYFFFAPALTAADVGAEYQRWMDLPEIFGTGIREHDKEIFWATGFASQQDDIAISFTPAEVGQKMNDLASSRTFEELSERYRLCTTNQWNYGEAKRFAGCGEWQKFLAQVAYRPFDRRWTVQHKNVLTILRKRVMSQLTGQLGENLGLISSRAVNDHAFAHCFIVREPVDKIFISSKTSTNAYVFPLFVVSEDLNGRRRRPNFSRGFLRSLAGAIGVTGRGEYDIPDGLTPNDILHYIYAILHSPKYRSRYEEPLKIEFPRIPPPGSVGLFDGLAQIGLELASTHMMEAPLLDNLITTYIGPDEAEVGKVSYSGDTAWLDRGQKIGFAGVPDSAWNFYVGGYQVCQKWLKDRRGRSLSKGEIAHYQRVVVAVNETVKLMGKIDELIDGHGGWPGAFAERWGV